MIDNQCRKSDGIGKCVVVGCLVVWLKREGGRLDSKRGSRFEVRDRKSTPTCVGG